MKTAPLPLRVACWLSLVVLSLVARAQGLPMPMVQIVSPASGSSHPAHSKLTVRADAVDSDGYTSYAAFYMDGVKVAEQALNFLIPPPPGETQSYEAGVGIGAPGEHRISVVVSDDRGNRGEASVAIRAVGDTANLTLVKAGSVWKYNARNVDLGHDWVKPDYDDHDWPAGPAQLGFGDGDEATKVPATEPRQPTVYFRHEFQVPADFPFSNQILRLVRDDGAVVWLNGIMLVSANMPGPATFDSLALSSAGDDGNTWHDFIVGSEHLIPGRNVLAVEVHQVNLASSDLSFDLELIAVPSPGPAIVSIEATRPSTGEPCPTCRFAPGLFTLRRIGGLNLPLDVWLKVGGTATLGKDYASIPARVQFGAGQESATLEVAALDDLLVEGDESVVAELVIPVANALPFYDIDPHGARAEVVIHDDDSQTGGVIPVVSIEATQAVTGEPCPACLVIPGIFTIKRTGSTVASLPVYLSYSGTAIPGADYEKLSDLVEIPAGKASTEIVVLARQDNLVEEPETVVAMLNPDQSLSPVPNYTVDPNQAAAKVLITDGPDFNLAPTVGVTVSREQISECPVGAACRIPPIEIVFRRTNPRLVDPLTVFIDWKGTAAFGKDFGLSDLKELPRTVTFAAGSETATLLLSAWNDCIVEETEDIAVHIQPDPTLGPIERYRVSLDRGAARMVILDAGNPLDVAIPVVSIRGAGATRESCPPNADCLGLGFIVTRTGGDLAQPLEVQVEYSGTAIPGADYAKLPGSVIIPSGERSVSIGSSSIDDKLVEGDETVVASLVCSDATVPGYLISGAGESATVTILDDDALPDRAVVEILEPRSGSIFIDPVSIRFVARTVDPKGAITRLEWFDGELSIGVSEILFIRETDPGSEIGHEFTWQKPPTGDHKVRAVGITAAGLRVEGAILVAVSREVTAPVVTVQPGVAETSEVPPGSRRPLIPATFILRRTGSVEHPLRAVYVVGGSARNGRDYGFLDGDATFAAGESERVIYVSPSTDEILEGDETVEVSLEPRDTYTVGRPGAARVVIHDAQQPTTARLTWVEPQPGAQFEAGSNLKLVVTAIDPQGYFGHVDFTANGKVIGGDNLILCESLDCEPPPGTPIQFTFEWRVVDAGEYGLIASAHDANGTVVTTDPLRIVVGRTGGRSFVSRTLPPTFRPLAPFVVSLVATPPAAAGNYGVEDHPPSGWSIGKISEGGAWDPAHGAVKFGPFLDTKARTLTYEVTPPVGAAGQANFAGTAALDGASSVIGGQQSMSAEARLHPADSAPADLKLTLVEVTAYGAAWKNGTEWPVGPNPIPLDYVTRAGALWRGGEEYRCDPAGGPAPLCWINTSPNGVKNVVLDLDLPPADLTANIEEVRARKSFATAEWVATGTGDTLRIRTLPGAGVRVQAVEQTLPPATTVREISDGGVLDAKAGIVRWGPFYDDTARTLTAIVVGRQAGGFSGAASFDGASVPLGAAVDATAPGATAGPRIAEVRPLADGSMQLLVVDPAAQGNVVEYSDDLVTWHRIGESEAGAENQIHHDTDANESRHRFYRALRKP